MNVDAMFSSCCGQGEEREESTGSSSPQHGQEEDEDEEDVPKVVEMEEDIPLAKTGFTVPPAFAPIQVSPGCDHYSIKMLMCVCIHFYIVVSYKCYHIHVYTCICHMCISTTEYTVALFVHQDALGGSMCVHIHACVVIFSKYLVPALMVGPVSTGRGTS